MFCSNVHLKRIFSQWRKIWDRCRWMPMTFTKASLLPMRGVRSEIRECRSISDSDVVATEQTWPHVTIWTLNYADRTPTPGTTCSGAEFVFVYLRGQSSIRKTLWFCAALTWHDVSFQSLTILLAQYTSCPWDFILLVLPWDGDLDSFIQSLQWEFGVLVISRTIWKLSFLCE